MRRKEKSVGEVLGTAFISFIVTNIDDLVVLMDFFTEATMLNSSLKVRHIVIGQYLGFIILLGFSLIGYAVSYAIPVEMLGFLGFLPIILGIKGIIEIIIEQYKKRNPPVSDISPKDQISTTEPETIHYRKDIDGESISNFRNEQEQQKLIVDPPPPIKFKQKILKLLNHCFNPQILKVTSITLANSGDNIAIYTPLFAQATEWQIVVYIGIFLGMVLVWLVFCYYFINFRPILSIAQKYARYIVPIAFLGIGIYIIITSDCFPWLVRAIQTKNFKNG
jgi:cadmium resistance protein CadD (predicted permease)